MRVIALDLDGTLLDCKERQSLLAATLCRAADLELDIEAFWTAKRAGATTASAISMQGIDATLASKLSRLWVEQVESDVWLRMDRLFPGVMHSLHDAHELGFHLHLVTARSNARALTRQLRWLSLAPFFDHVEIVCPHEASRQKAIYLAALAPLVYIGDAESDAAAANVARVKFLAVTSGQRSSAYLQLNTNLGTQEIKSGLQEALADFYHANR